MHLGSTLGHEFMSMDKNHELSLPHLVYQPGATSWTRRVIRSLREYTYSQWKERNSHIHGVDLKASQAIRRKHTQQQITTAYHNKSTIPGDEQSFTFATPLIDRLKQPTSLLNAWLLQYKAGQHRLANQLKQEQRNQGKITKFLIARTTGRRPPTPPD